MSTRAPQVIEVRFAANGASISITFDAYPTNMGGSGSSVRSCHWFDVLTTALLQDAICYWRTESEMMIALSSRSTISVGDHITFPTKPDWSLACVGLRRR